MNLLVYAFRLRSSSQNLHNFFLGTQIALHSISPAKGSSQRLSGLHLLWRGDFDNLSLYTPLEQKACQALFPTCLLHSLCLGAHIRVLQRKLQVHLRMPATANKGMRQLRHSALRIDSTSDRDVQEHAIRMFPLLLFQLGRTGVSCDLGQVYQLSVQLQLCPDSSLFSHSFM